MNSSRRNFIGALGATGLVGSFAVKQAMAQTPAESETIANNGLNSDLNGQTTKNISHL